jgi:flagellar hook-associated protein 3 FlgL
MQSTLNPSSALFLANVNRIERQVATANNQITSGRKINVASDAPDEIDNLLQLRANLERNTQIQSNLQLANTDALAADNAIGSAVTLLDRAIQLATSGANSISTADSRNSLAQEVASVQAQMVALSLTQVQGRYIFSGDQDNSPAYELNLLPPPDPTAPVDPTQPVDPAACTGVNQLSGAPATQQTEDPAGGTFAVSQTATQIFNTTNDDGSPAGDNVFAALNSLRIGLLNNDPAAIANSLSSLRIASTHLDNMQAFYGTVENRIQDSTDFANKYGTQLQTEISDTQDADASSAAMMLTQANTQLQASFAMQAKMPTQTLFDFLA